MLCSIVQSKAIKGPIKRPGKTIMSHFPLKQTLYLGIARDNFPAYPNSHHVKALLREGIRRAAVSALPEQYNALSQINNSGQKRKNKEDKIY